MVVRKYFTASRVARSVMKKKCSRLKFFSLSRHKKIVWMERFAFERERKTTIDFFNHTFRSGGRSLSRNYIEMQIREKFTIIFYSCLICGNVVVGAAKCEWNCLEKRFKAFSYSSSWMLWSHTIKWIKNYVRPWYNTMQQKLLILFVFNLRLKFNSKNSTIFNTHKLQLILIKWIFDN